MTPSIIQKDSCGWTNYSGTVINHKMSENEMGYRGSKSVRTYDFKNKNKFLFYKSD